LPLCQ